MFRLSVIALILALAVFAGETKAQGLQARANEIRAAMDGRDFDRADALVREVRAR